MGRAIRLGDFREDLTVSKMISSCGVIAMPTSADCGVPSPEMLDTTPKRCRTMNACKAIRSIVELLNFHRNYSPHRYGSLWYRPGYRLFKKKPPRYGSVRIGDEYWPTGKKEGSPMKGKTDNPFLQRFIGS